jgi:hypothetical protein
MDGMTRRELEFPPIELKNRHSIKKNEVGEKGDSPKNSNQVEAQERNIRAYVVIYIIYMHICVQYSQFSTQLAPFLFQVGGRDVLRTWERSFSPVVILLPDDAGWRDKHVRILADEIAFYNQASEDDMRYIYYMPPIYVHIETITTTTQVIVLIPDIHRGDPWDSKLATSLYEEWADRHFPASGEADEPAVYDHYFNDVISAVHFANVSPCPPSSLFLSPSLIISFGLMCASRRRAAALRRSNTTARRYPS